MAIRLERPTNEFLFEHKETFLSWFIDVARSSGDEFQWGAIPRSINNGDLDAWVAMDGDELMGFIAGSIAQYANGDTFVVSAAAGTTKGMYAHFDKLLVEIAEANNCVAYEARGRRGWLRAFKQAGAVEKYTTVRREL